MITAISSVMFCVIVIAFRTYVHEKRIEKLRDEILGLNDRIPIWWDGSW